MKFLFVTIPQDRFNGDRTTINEIQGTLIREHENKCFGIGGVKIELRFAKEIFI